MQKLLKKYYPFKYLNIISQTSILVDLAKDDRIVVVGWMKYKAEFVPTIDSLLSFVFLLKETVSIVSLSLDNKHMSMRMTSIS